MNIIPPVLHIAINTVKRLHNLFLKGADAIDMVIKYEKFKLQDVSNLSDKDIIELKQGVQNQNNF